MKLRVAKKILRRWSWMQDGSVRPRGNIPWRWSTWCEAHRVWTRGCNRDPRRDDSRPSAVCARRVVRAKAGRRALAEGKGEG